MTGRAIMPAPQVVENYGGTLETGGRDYLDACDILGTMAASELRRVVDLADRYARIRAMAEGELARRDAARAGRRLARQFTAMGASAIGRPRSPRIEEV